MRKSRSFHFLFLRFHVIFTRLLSLSRCSLLARVSSILLWLFLCSGLVYRQITYCARAMQQICLWQSVKACVRVVNVSDSCVSRTIFFHSFHFTLFFIPFFIASEISIYIRATWNDDGRMLEVIFTIYCVASSFLRVFSSSWYYYTSNVFWRQVCVVRTFVIRITTFETINYISIFATFLLGMIACRVSYIFSITIFACDTLLPPPPYILSSDTISLKNILPRLTSTIDKLPPFLSFKFIFYIVFATLMSLH